MLRTMTKSKADPAAVARADRHDAGPVTVPAGLSSVARRVQRDDRLAA